MTGLLAYEQSCRELHGVLAGIDPDPDSVRDRRPHIVLDGLRGEGARAETTGTTSEFPGASFNELDGDFVGTVDGAEVFRTERLGG